MGKLDLHEIGGLGRKDCAACEYDNEVTYDLLNHKLVRIAKSLEKASSYVFYIVGMGGQTKSVYRQVGSLPGVELVFVRSVLPKPIGFLSFFVASFAGLVKITDLSKLSEVFLILTEQSMSGLYVVPKVFENKFLNIVRCNVMPESYDFGVKENKDYFFYIVDMDSSESSTGIYEIVSYGIGADYIAGTL